MQDATGTLWSDEWKIEASPLVEYTLWGMHNVKAQIHCEDGGTVETPAGRFENCMKVTIDVEGLSDGLSYRGGKEEYWFAPGVGIVRTANDYLHGTAQAVYKLTAYEGVGEGYMPMERGMMRRYDAMDLTDGYEGSAVYTYEADEAGALVIFTDRTGIRNFLSPVYNYASIYGEVIEERLWDEGKRDESRLRHDVNNFHILVHFFSRFARWHGMPKRQGGWNRYQMRVMESFFPDGVIPPAWEGRYA